MKQLYDSYKPSGIDWIGEIPSHWGIMPLKRQGITNTGLTFTKADLVEDGNPVVSYGQVHADYNDKVHLSSRLIRYVPDSILKRTSSALVNKGSFIFADTSEDLDGCGNAVYNDTETPIYAGYHTIVLKRKDENGKYLAYLFQTDSWRSQIRSQVSGVKVFSITQTILSSTSIIVPPLSEQEAIAAWLDEKCGEIDSAIAKVDREIELIDELKQSEISRVVTRGLNPDAPLHPSAIDWIGDVPEHWKVKRLRFVCEFRNGYTPSKDNKEFWTNGTIPWYRMEDIRDSGRFLNEAKQYISEEAIKGGGLFEAGSFILATTATIGEHAMLIVDSLANQQFTNLKIRKSLIEPVSKEFFFYYLFVIDEFCKSTTKTTTFPAMDMTDLRNFGVCIPPLSEQKEIAKYLDKKCAEIDGLKEKLVKKRETLKELRQATISEVVTGKRKVI